MTKQNSLYNLKKHYLNTKKEVRTKDELLLTTQQNVKDFEQKLIDQKSEHETQISTVLKEKENEIKGIQGEIANRD